MEPQSSVDMAQLARDVKEEARAAGFDLCGITSAAPFEHEGKALAEWVDRGYHGEMGYMARNAPRSGTPQTVVPEARALVVVGLYYDGNGETAGATPEGPAGPHGRISRYAQGRDYHQVMDPRL